LFFALEIEFLHGSGLWTAVEIGNSKKSYTYKVVACARKVVPTAATGQAAIFRAMQTAVRRFGVRTSAD